MVTFMLTCILPQFKKIGLSQARKAIPSIYESGVATTINRVCICLLPQVAGFWEAGAGPLHLCLPDGLSLVLVYSRWPWCLLV